MPYHCNSQANSALLLLQVDYALELIDEIHPIAKTPLYVVYPSLRPFRRVLACLPGMQFEEAGVDQEMKNLLSEAGEPQTVKINGREVLKKKKPRVQKQVNAKKVEQDPLA